MLFSRVSSRHWVSSAVITAVLFLSGCGGGGSKPVAGDNPEAPANGVGGRTGGSSSSGGSTGPSANVAPSAPTGLMVVSVSDTSATLRWQASAGTVARYEVFRGDSRLATASTTGVTLSNLQTGTIYNLRVRAVDNQNQASAYSNTVVAKTTMAGAIDPVVAMFAEQGCAGCHGANGQGTELAGDLTQSATIAELATAIDLTMPPANPSACTGSCASTLASYIFNNFTIPSNGGTTPAPGGDSPGAVTGAALYTQAGCATCHGVDGLGTPLALGLTRTMVVTDLAAIINQTMPPTNPALCDSVCAADLANYIAANFMGKGVEELVTEPLEGFPKGNAQIDTVCARIAQANGDHVVRDAFCGANRPTITSLVQLQTALGLNFNSPNLVGRGNNGQGGNPGFTLTGHSSSLVARFTSAINPRAIFFTPPNQRNPVPGFITMGFVRGEQFAEIIVSDRNTRELFLFLVAFEKACNATNSCTNGDLLTPAVETGWTSFTLYDEVDLQNTIVDCLHCHQTQGPGTQKILRMQELQNPWTHFFRDNRAGGVTLFNDFRAAHGQNEDYAGIPAALLNSGDPARLEDVVRGNGFRNQPNEFLSGTIENEVRTSNPAQPQNNDTPGTSATWNRIYQNATQGNAIPVPYHDVKVTDSQKLAAMTQAYQAFRAGNLAAADLPDIRDVFLESRAFEMGFAADPSLDGQGVIAQACSQCHNSRLNQNISRSRFNVNLDQMSNLNGGVLTGLERDQEIGTAINRLNFPQDDVRKMPPDRFRTLSPADIAKATAYLCSQTVNPIPQCVSVP